MSASFIFGLLDEMAQRGCLWLLFTGGEPLLRRDFRDIYVYAKKKGFLVTLFSNATLITPELADLLEEWPPFEVEVTLYGATSQVYEKMAGIPGSFKKCLDGIKLLLERNIKTSLKTMVTTINSRELADMKKIAAGFGLDFRLDPLLHSRLDGGKMPCEYRVTPDEAVELDITEKERRDAWLKCMEVSKNWKAADSFLSCGAGVDSFSIDPYGNMSLCSMMPKRAFSLKRYSFGRVWDDFFPKVLDKEYNKKAKCRNCDAVLYCANCPGWSSVETGQEDAVVDYLCEIAYKRKDAFEKQPFINRVG